MEERGRSLFAPVFLTLLGALAAPGCAPTRLYPGPPRPLNEIAVVEGSSAIDEERKVVSINGAELPPFRGQTYELEPGRYKIAITTSDGFWVVTSMVEPCDVDLVAEAGHRYKIEAHGSGPRWWVYLVDSNTGEKLPCIPRRPAYFE